MLKGSAFPSRVRKFQPFFSFYRGLLFIVFFFFGLFIERTWLFCSDESKFQFFWRVFFSLEGFSYCAVSLVIACGGVEQEMLFWCLFICFNEFWW